MALIPGAKLDHFAVARRIVHEICERWPLVTPKQESELVAILCTSEGELTTEEVFDRFQAQPNIRIQGQAWAICRSIQVEREHLDQMSQENRWMRGEIPYTEREFV